MLSSCCHNIIDDAAYPLLNSLWNCSLEIAWRTLNQCILFVHLFFFFAEKSAVLKGSNRPRLLSTGTLHKIKEENMMEKRLKVFQFIIHFGCSLPHSSDSRELSVLSVVGFGCLLFLLFSLSLALALLTSVLRLIFNWHPCPHYPWQTRYLRWQPRTNNFPHQSLYSPLILFPVHLLVYSVYCRSYL